MLIHNERDVLIQSLEKEMTVSTQELHLSDALALQWIGSLIGLIEQCDGGVDTGNAVVEALPHVTDVPVRCQNALRDFKLMEHVTVAGTIAALVGIVTAYIIVPHRERGVDILSGNPNGIGRDDEVINILGRLHLFIRQNTLWGLFVKEVGAAGRQHAESQGSYIYRLFHGSDNSVRM